MKSKWLALVILSLGIGVAAAHAEEKEVKMKLDEVPAAVKETLTKAANGAAIDAVDKEGEGDAAVYEADVKIDGQNYEIKVSGDGKLISKAIDKEDEKGGDKKDEKGEH